MRALLLALLFTPAMVSAQSPRDVGLPPQVGTAVISGTVVADDASGTPVPRVVVSLSAGNQRGERRGVTDEKGHFVIDQLPAASYSLSAAKAGWITSFYGSSHPGRPPFGGATISVAAGERAPAVTLKLLRGSIVTGVIRDPFGRPASGVSMQLATVHVQDGERKLSINFAQSQGPISELTDDRGIYRFYAVAPGDYVLSAQPGFLNFGDTDIQQVTADDLAAARRAVTAGAVANSSGASAPQAAAAAPRPPTVTGATVYYPGTTELAAATLLRIGRNDERSAIDFSLQLVPTAHVQGVVMGVDGQPVGNAIVQLASPPAGDFMYFSGSTQTRSGPDGRFQFLGVQPGPYQVSVRAADTRGASGRAGGAGAGMSVAVNGGVATVGGGPGANVLWAFDSLVVADQDVSGLTLTLQPGVTVSGHVVFAGAAPPTPADLERVRITLSPVAATTRLAMGAVTATPDAAGAFHLTNVAPGRYRVNAVIPVLAAGRRGGGAAPPSATPWVLRAATTGDVDAVDHPVEVTPTGPTPELTVTLSDHLSEIDGSVKTASGQPVTTYRIVVVSADKSMWGTSNRRMRPPVQTERDGTFRVTNLPAGSYFLAAVTDMELDDMTDMAFLEDLTAHAIPITLGDGEKKLQDLKVSGGF